MIRRGAYTLNQIVYYYLKLLGLCPFKFSNENILVRCNVSTIYTCILSVIYTVVFIFMTKYRFTSIFSFETPMFVITKTLSVILEFLAIMSIWMNGVFLQHVLRDIIKSFKHVSNSLRRFGCQEDHNINTWRINCFVSIVYSAYIILLIWDMIIHPTSTSVNWLVRSIFDFFRIVSHIIAFFFICALAMLKRHLCFINGFIRQFPDNLGSSIKDGVITRRIQRHDADVMCLRELGQVYMDLHALLKMIEIYFRSPMVFLMITHFINGASYFYVICLYFNEKSNANITVTFSLFFVWLVIYSVEVLATIEAVNSLILQGNHTGNIFHGMITKYCVKDVVDAVNIISLQILQEPMKFSLYGFINLNSLLLYRVSSAMATYFLILMQLDIQNKGLIINE